MIYGIGIDIVDIDKIKKIVMRNGDKLAKRILSQFEFKIYMRKKSLSHAVRFLAKRFAAKEAAVKAFGIGMRQKITFNQFEVSNDILGKPSLHLISFAALLSEQLLLKNIYITLSDTNTYACAMVIFEC